MRKKVCTLIAFISIICAGFILISGVNYMKMEQTQIDPEKDYYLISEDNSFQDLPYILGNKLSLLANDEKTAAARMSGFCRGFDQFRYSKGYLCYKKTYASSLLISTMFIDGDRLYVCSLSPEKITKEIENVDGYFLDGEKLIYEDTGGDLYYYNIRTEEKQKIIGKWDDYRDISIDNIRWTDKDSFYILDDNRKQLYCYSIKDNRGVRIAEAEKNILGVIPKGEDVLLYLSSGEIAEYSMADQKVAVLISGIDASIYMEDGAWRQKMSDNVIGCPFTIGGDGRLYYDNNLKLYAYDFQEKVSEEIIDFSNMEKFRTEEELEDDPFYYSYNYIIGKDSVILIQSETGKGEYVGFYDFNGELKKKELVKFSKWNTNKFARNFGY